MGPDTLESFNPATGESLGTVPRADGADVAAAVERAREAYDAWRLTPAPKRAEVLYRFDALLVERKQELTELMAREVGKVLAEAGGVGLVAIDMSLYMAGEGRRLFGHTTPSELPDKFMMSVRMPVGVVGAITPWNFPIAIPAWKLAPALICGNTVILKPASVSPLSAWRIVEACHEAGIPKGVVNFIAGSGGEIGKALVNAAPMKAISFTGSCEIGNWIHAEASKRRLRIQLEMGGKNPTIVLADADFGSAVENCVNASFFSTGQKCTATSRVIVEDAIYDKFVDAVVERTKKLKVGNGMEAGIDIGPAIDQGQLDTNLKYIEIAKKEGAALKCGGNRLTGGAYDKGYFVEPTVFADVTEAMTIAQEEIFGPVLAIMRAKDFEDALRIANNVPFGLSASIQTTNVSRVFDFVYKMEAGLLTVNLPSAGVEYQLPFGGTRDSSFGAKEQGPAALEFYSDYKTVYLKY